MSKHSPYRSAALALMAVAMPVVSGCSSEVGGSSEASSADAALPKACEYQTPEGVAGEVPTPKKDSLTIGIINPLGSNEAQVAVQQAAEAEVKRLGGTSRVFDAKGQPSEQVAGFEQLLNQGVDAILVPAPLDQLALNPVLERAASDDVPVIALEGYSDPADPIPGYATNVLLGRDLLAFTHVSEMAKRHPEGQVVIIKFGVPVPSIETYAERAAYWAEQCGLEVVDTVANPTDDAAGAQTVVTPVLQKYPDLVGALAYNDQSAVGASTAARGLSRGLTAFGMNGASDAFSAVEGGQVELSLQLPYVADGVMMVDAAYAHVQGLDTPTDVMMDPSFSIVTKESIEDGTAQTFEEQLAELG